jgi:hypothetical protein
VLGRLKAKFSITTAYIVFFDYFSALFWLARLCGIRHVIYEMQNSGEFRAESWRNGLLRRRTRMMTTRVTRVIAISEFVRQQLVNAELAEGKMGARYLGVDTERFKPTRRHDRNWQNDSRSSPMK